MRRLRPLRRRARQREREEQTSPLTSAWSLGEDQGSEDEPGEFVPFVPVSREVSAYQQEDRESEKESAPPELARQHKQRLRVPHFHVWHPSLGIEIRFPALLLALALVAAGVFGTLLNQGEVRQSLKEWWPLVMLAIAVLWMFVALVRRQVASFLGGAALAGIGFSLLMDTQHIAAVKDTLLGMVLVTLGLGIVIRGFLLRQQTPLQAIGRIETKPDHLAS